MTDSHPPLGTVVCVCNLWNRNGTLRESATFKVTPGTPDRASVVEMAIMFGLLTGGAFHVVDDSAPMGERMLWEGRETDMAKLGVTKDTPQAEIRAAIRKARDDAAEYVRAALRASKIASGAPL